MCMGGQLVQVPGAPPQAGSSSSSRGSGQRGGQAEGPSGRSRWSGPLALCRANAGPMERGPWSFLGPGWGRRMCREGPGAVLPGDPLEGPESDV